MTVQAIVALLADAVKDKVRLSATIAEVQRAVWNEEVEGAEKELEVLRDLAIDLDYFEPNAKWRDEDPSYYGEDRALAEIRAALAKLALN